MREDKNGGPNHLKAWRLNARLTQEELAAVIDPPTTGAVISLLEEGERALSAKWLRRLAPALGTTPGRLLENRPDEVDEAEDIFHHIPPERREMALKVLETFRTGTNDE